MMMKYAGIGSRNTPILSQYLFEEIGSILAGKGFTLRSGHAFGADFAFETGCNRVNGAKEIFIPWKGFNQANEILVTDPMIVHSAIEIAASIHPAWDRLSRAAKLLHIRNIFQVAGEKIDDPVDFVLCWTKDSADVGGTRTAIVFARRLKIPVFNFGNFSAQDSDDLTASLRDSCPEKIISVFEKFMVDTAVLI